MAATIYRGTLNGTGSNYFATLYENTTGKNARLVWSYVKAFSPNPATDAEFYVGTTSNPDHNNGNDLETWFFRLLVVIQLENGYPRCTVVIKIVTICMEVLVDTFQLNFMYQILRRFL